MEYICLEDMVIAHRVEGDIIINKNDIVTRNIKSSVYNSYTYISHLGDTFFIRFSELDKFFIKLKDHRELNLNKIFND